MLVEPLQALDLMTTDLPPDTWDEDDARRDAVWLAAGEHALRREFISGGADDPVVSHR